MRNRRSQTETEERVNEPLPLPHWSTASPQLGLPRALSSTQTRAPATSRRNTRTHIANPRSRLLASARTEQRVPTDASTTPCRHSRHRQTPKEDWADAHSAPRDARPCALENVRGRPLRHLHAMRHECARMGAAGGTTVATLWPRGQAGYARLCVRGAQSEQKRSAVVACADRARKDRIRSDHPLIG